MTCKNFYIAVIISIFIILFSSVAHTQEDDALIDVVEQKTDLEKINLETSEFSNETRIGFSNATGNTRAISVLGDLKIKYRYKRFENVWRAGANYYRVFSSTNQSTLGTSSRYIWGTYRFDYFINHWLSYFLGGGGYTDVIKGIDLAGQSFTGFRFFLVQTPETNFNISLGHNFTHEDRLPPSPTKRIHAVMAEFVFTQKIGEVLTFEEEVVALEDILHGYDIRINNGTDLKVKLSKHLGLVISFDLRLDNRPAIGYKKLDTLSGLELAVTF